MSLKARIGHGEVLEASSIAEAQLVARACRVDVLVTDVVLPDGSGFDLIASLEVSQDAYVIVYSNFTADELRAGLGRHRIDQFVSKENGLRGLSQAVLVGLAAQSSKRAC